MKAFFDFTKEVGWMGAIALFLLIAGMAAALDMSMKDLFDLSSVSWTTRRMLGVIVSFVGILMVAATLSHFHRQSQRGVLVSRQHVYENAFHLAQSHKALSSSDDPRFVSRVVQSAHLFEKEMRDAAKKQEVPDTTGDFLLAAATLAKEFYISLEGTEYVNRLNLASDDVREDQLPQKDYDDFKRRRMEWVMRTETLFQGAAAMLGVKPPSFYW